MKICRFQPRQGQSRVGLLLEDDSLLDLSAANVNHIDSLLEEQNLIARLTELSNQRLPRVPMAEARLLAPVERQEVWAVGVTYLRSKKARMEESDFSATAYDRVYDAPRPELFFKALPQKVVAPGEAVGIRKDARWNVPEPELTLVINSRGQIAGYTVGNDMSARDIEGENLLYLPQAKIYDRSCALGPFINVGADESTARGWNINLQIRREGQIVFDGSTSVGQIKRTFAELVACLFHSQTFPHGAVLLTGTGIVPPDNFTLAPEDNIRISISGIGTLENSVVQV
jgi:2-dehydro-3-deoxy-D-arabinonate dehydratase